MDFDIEVEGDTQLITKFSGMSEAVASSVFDKIEYLVSNFIEYVRTQKLSGQVLHNKSGALSNSLAGSTSRGDGGIDGTVTAGSGIKYAAIQEYGGTTKAHEIFPNKAGALAFMNEYGHIIITGKVDHPGSVIPERSYMRTSLAENTDNIAEQIKIAALEAINR